MSNSPAAPAGWGAVTRFVFRAWFVFASVLVLPRSIEFYVNTGVWPWIANWTGRWPLTHVLRRPEHLLAGPMSGADYLPDFIAAAVIGGFSLLAAIVWSALSAQRDHPTLFACLHTTVRFLLGSLLLFYAWNKILPGQFGHGPNLEKIVRPVAQLTPMELLWAFMSASRTYVVFSGLAEFAAGVMLFMRRTAVLGAMLSTLAMTNVLMLNLAYDVGVKFLAAQMLVMALSLLIPHLTRLSRILLLREPIGLLPVPPLWRSRWRDQSARACGIAFAVIMIWWTYGMARKIVSQNSMSGSFHGVWEIEAMERNGTVVPLLVTDESLWRQLIFPADDTAVFVCSMSGAQTPYSARVDSTARALTFTPRPFAASRARQTTWAFRLVDFDHLELSGQTDIEPTVMRFRRVDIATWPLLTHRHGWRW